MTHMTVEQALVLGHDHLEAGRLEQAELVVRALLELAADRPEVQRLAGLLAYWRGQTQQAVALVQRAVELAPEWGMAYDNLSFLWHRLGEFEAAEAAARKALALEPGFAAHSNLATALRDLGRFDEAIEHFREALLFEPDSPAVHGAMLYSMQFLPGITPEALAEAHAEWDHHHAAPLRAAAHTPPIAREPRRRLRVGFVSPDLGRHPVGCFLEAILEQFRAQDFEVYCYSDRRKEDQWTARIEAACAGWRRIAVRPDAEVVQLIHNDRIDVLFDLAGHTAENRLLMFAGRAAPVQITWLGYVGTTGLAAMDYVLADRWHIPPGEEGLYRERVLRMPHGYVCWRAPADAPAVGPLPALTRGYVTFGSFNKATKCNPEVIALWAELLQRVPSARLTLRNKGLASGAIRQRIVGQFQAAGIGPDRVDLLDWMAPGELMAAYNEIDIALDTFPYSGGATTCEALWMGVPVVTWPGRTFASRHSLSHLSNVGLTETIAGSRADYVDKAAALAGDVERLAHLRRGLREKMAASPLCDPAQFAKDLADRLRAVWSGSEKA
jgi:protein O-GlcNAc transferase